jgi:deoxyribodipyrimidine photo-lyase
VFCFDDRLLAGRHASPARTRFLLESLAELDGALRERGSALVVRRGPPERELPALARELGATTLHHAADVGPYARRRDERVRAALERAGVHVDVHPGVFAVDDVGAIRAQDGSPYSVFAAFHRAWLREPRRDVLAAPRRLPPPPAGLAAGALPALAELGFVDASLRDPPRGGERAARARARRMLSGARLGAYGGERDQLGHDGTSGLSPYLHLGCISARDVESRAGGPDAAAFRRQLCWRDFLAAVLLADPSGARSAHQRRYRGAVRWSRSKTRFDTWCDGRTGVPLVDAAMRQLRAEGWLPNRARLVAASFLVHHLWIDWRWGERWFMSLLIDGDEASNNGNWQWVAAVGVDPAPPYKRVLNPLRQQARFDPDGAYVRRNVPELRAVADRWLAAPWEMPEEEQRRVRCVIGRDYPAPVVDLAIARRAALERHARVRGVIG